LDIEVDSGFPWIERLAVTARDITPLLADSSRDRYVGSLYWPPKDLVIDRKVQRWGTRILSIGFYKYPVGLIERSGCS
jgi:hypothetical protein